MAKCENNSDDSRIGILGTLAGIGFVGFLIKALKKERKAKAQAEKRKNTPCAFNDGISQLEFNDMVEAAGKRIKRLTSLIPDGPVVYGTVESQSGISEWSFVIDFNDYGHITGEYWITSDNYDSEIPERVAEHIRKAILNFRMDDTSFYDESEYDENVDEDDDLSEEYDTANRNEKIHEFLKEKKNRKICLILILAAIIVAALFFACYEYSKLVPVNYSSQSLIGLEYKQVVKRLEDAGFSNVSTEEIDNLSANQVLDEYVVTDVKIGWITSFSNTAKLPSNFPVTVTYHTLEKIEVPMSNKEAKGSTYEEVEKAFKEAGFINVSTVAEYDIITGWLADDGEVKSVVVDGDKKYDSGDEYKLNSNVVITYHTLRKNKPN